MPFSRDPASAAERTSRSQWMARKREGQMKTAGSQLQVIYQPGRCWCGKPYGHTWPGQVRINGCTLVGPPNGGTPHPPKESKT